jgi:hypothetical protein
MPSSARILYCRRIEKKYTLISPEFLSRMGSSSWVWSSITYYYDEQRNFTCIFSPRKYGSPELVSWDRVHLSITLTSLGGIGIYNVDTRVMRFSDHSLPRMYSDDTLRRMRIEEPLMTSFQSPNMQQRGFREWDAVNPMTATHLPIYHTHQHRLDVSWRRIRTSRQVYLEIISQSIVIEQAIYL